MLRFVLSTILISLIINAHTQTEAIEFRGKVFFFKSDRTPAKGVSVSAKLTDFDVFATPVYSTSDGSFTLCFSKKAIDDLNLNYDPTIDIKVSSETEDGIQIEVVNDRLIDNFNLYEKRNTPEIIVCKKGEREESALIFYGLVKASLIERLSSAEDSIEMLREAGIEHDSEIKGLESDIMLLEKQLSDSVSNYKEALRLASINTDSSSEEVKNYIEGLTKGRTFSELEGVMNPKKAFSIGVNNMTESYYQKDLIELEARRLWSCGDWAGACRMFDTLCIFAREMRDDKVLVEALSTTSNYYYQFNSDSIAILRLLEADKVLQKYVARYTEKIQILEELSNSCMRTNTNKANKYLNRAHSLWIEKVGNFNKLNELSVNDQFTLARLMKSKGQLFNLNGKDQLAEEFLFKASAILLPMLDNSNEINSEFAHCQFLYGLILLDRENLQLSEAILQTALKLYEQLLKKTGSAYYESKVSSCLSSLGTVYIKKGDYHSAETNLKKSIEFYTFGANSTLNLTQKKSKASGLMTLAAFYSDNGEFYDADSICILAKSMLDGHFPLLELDISFQQMTAYYGLKRYDELDSLVAIVFTDFQKQNEEYKERNIDIILQILIFSGDSQIRRKNYQAAVNKFLEIVEIVENLNKRDKRFISELHDAYYNVGNSYFEKKEFDKALKYYKKSLFTKRNASLSDDIKVMKSDARSNMSIGNLYFQKDNFKMSKKYLFKSLSAYSYFDSSDVVYPKSEKFKIYYLLAHNQRRCFNLNQAEMTSSDIERVLIEGLRYCDVASEFNTDRPSPMLDFLQNEIVKLHLFFTNELLYLYSSGGRSKHD